MFYRHFKVPDNELREMKLKRLECIPTQFNQQLPLYCSNVPRIKSAHLLKMCDEMIESNFGNWYTLLLIEIDQDFSALYPCLADQTTEVPKDVTLLKFDEAVNEFETYISTIFWSNSRIDNRIGRPLLKVSGRKLTVLGTSTYGSVSPDGHGENQFLNIKWFRDDLCSLAGICGNKREMTTITTTTTTKLITETKITPLSIMTTIEAKVTTTEDYNGYNTQTVVTSNPPPTPSTTSEPEDYFFDDRYFKHIDNPYGVGLEKCGRKCELWILVLLVVLLK
uniref:Uncharacterized protein n=1 Tax=Caenorhabditis tropicalis TaxID=1561998 RepID=A0A1I7TBU6_9PELO